ncbi:MAG: DUF4446 family protein [Clostridia bacterium]|nr:DUF4446 family protein [Clostridia bacterium]
MERLIEIFKTDTYIFIFNISMFLLLIIMFFYILYLHKNYISFMKKIGNGKNIDEMLKNYLEEIETIKKDNSEIKAYYTKLDYEISSSIQKVGLVRFNAFQNVGSDLSFALALLDRDNNGVVLNGIYGSDSSNIYAKPIKNGNSTYKLSEEEKEAIEIACNEKVLLTKHKENKF